MDHGSVTGGGGGGVFRIKQQRRKRVGQPLALPACNLFKTNMDRGIERFEWLRHHG